MHRRAWEGMLAQRNVEGVMARSSRSWWVLVGWVVALAAGIAAGHALGAGALAVPGIEAAAWRTWATTTEPLVVSMALLRVLAVTAGWYLLVATALGVTARVLRAVRLAHLADRISAPVVRRVLQRSMGVMVATALATSATTSGVRAAEPAPVAIVESESSTLTMRGLSSEGRDSEGDGVDPPDPPAPTLPWQRLLDEVAGGTADRAQVPDAVGGDGEGVSASGRTPGGTQVLVAIGLDGGTHVVRSGESLWRIAEERLAQARGRAAGDAGVVAYWRELIDVNRDRLVVADDPDLIVPGQELVLPPVVRS